ncbi:hypothetical protein SK875_C00439 [Burkholderia contaminans]|jgi:hypothetical protein|nr:hypothetical protein SK875_C00439 [Burkholderia contaminans]
MPCSQVDHAASTRANLDKVPDFITARYPDAA